MTGTLICVQRFLHVFNVSKLFNSRAQTSQESLQYLTPFTDQNCQRPTLKYLSALRRMCLSHNYLRTIRGSQERPCVITNTYYNCRPLCCVDKILFPRAPPHLYCTIWITIATHAMRVNCLRTAELPQLSFCNLHAWYNPSPPPSCRVNLLINLALTTILFAMLPEIFRPSRDVR